MYADRNERNSLPADGTGNGVARPKHWYAAYVRLYHEKKISIQLSKMGIENFLPVQEEIHQWSDRRKKIERILIPMIVFVRVTPTEGHRFLHYLPSAAIWYYMEKVPPQ